MKTSNIIFTAILFAAIITQSCTKEYSRIEGMGAITTETLYLDDFSGIDMEGADDVTISYGTEQKVEVTGHPNIISRIQTEVSNDTWHIELERGNYGEYELSYNIILPYIEEISYDGSGNVMVSGSMESDYLELSLLGSCSFYGFSLRVESCQVDITGSGNCEITAGSQLDVSIEGSGSVFYKGNPSVTSHITGSGGVVDSNQD
jgi:hypothetical protein